MGRDEFRNGVFTRDNYRCVVCDAPAVDAHHLIERRLWSDGGYVVDNGVSLCAACHLEAEKTNLSVEFLRERAGITKAIIPEHMYPDEVYDKWGNQILPSGIRLRGELWGDESVQKILRQSKYWHDFSRWVKYPRTYHLPFSNANDDDRMLANTYHFTDLNVVVTEKMDGENTSLYRDYIHARSLDSRNHFSRSWVKNFWSQISYMIPEGWRVCGENLYAKHSIGYDALPSFFMGFSIWNDSNVCLSWSETLEYFQLLGITPVPVLYEGVWDENKIRKLAEDSNREGFVVRVQDAFHFGKFRWSVAKYVRPDHVQTLEHWMYNRIELNSMR